MLAVANLHGDGSEEGVFLGGKLQVKATPCLGAVSEAEPKPTHAKRKDGAI